MKRGNISPALNVNDLMQKEEFAALMMASSSDMAERESNSLSGLSIVLGLSSYLLLVYSFAFFPPIALLSLLTAVLAIVFGIVGRKKEGVNGMNKAGVKLGIIFLALVFIGLIILLASFPIGINLRL